MTKGWRIAIFWLVSSVIVFFGACVLGMESYGNTHAHHGYWYVTGLAAIWMGLFLVIVVGVIIISVVSMAIYARFVDGIPFKEFF